MTQVTTKQVRAVIAQFGTKKIVYTNKTRGDASPLRRVKCYAGGSGLLAALRSLAGRENVRVLRNSPYGDSVIVKCVLG